MNIRNQKGSTIILFALVITVIIGFVGLAVDFGYAVLKDLQLTNAIDAATLAGAQDLDGTTDTTTAKDTAEAYLQKNGIDPSTVTITFHDDNKSIRLVSNNTVNNRFMKLLGINTTGIGASAKATIAPTTAFSSGLKPFGIILDYEANYEKDEYGNYVLDEYGNKILINYKLDDDGNKIPIPPAIGEPVTLETGAMYSPGNFGLLDFLGENDINKTIKDGYYGEVKIGDKIDTNPGIKASIENPLNYLDDLETRETEEFDFINKTYRPSDSPLFFVVPVVDGIGAIAGKDQVTVTGFAMLFFDAYTKKNEEGNKEVTGYFVKMIIPGDSSSGGEVTDFGVSSVKLVE